MKPLFSPKHTEDVLVLGDKYTLFYMNIFYKNIEAEIFEILRIFSE